MTNVHRVVCFWGCRRRSSTEQARWWSMFDSFWGKMGHLHNATWSFNKHGHKHSKVGDSLIFPGKNQEGQQQPTPKSTIAFQVTWWLRLPTWNHPLPPVVRPSPAAAKKPVPSRRRFSWCDGAPESGRGGGQHKKHTTVPSSRKKNWWGYCWHPPKNGKPRSFSGRWCLCSWLVAVYDGKKRSFS